MLCLLVNPSKDISEKENLKITLTTKKKQELWTTEHDENNSHPFYCNLHDKHIILVQSMTDTSLVFFTTK
jgi:hypothetical protein